MNSCLRENFVMKDGYMTTYFTLEDARSKMPRLVARASLAKTYHGLSSRTK